ncbi:DUF4244 domain-containing protein [Pseudarthrobacter sp. J1738]|uniref:DUF4244 domain-containing protein n=1 Tax=unclassified Pseudarthrobacter TaxID=2647000 RepID=UPI003D2BE230
MSTTTLSNQPLAHNSGPSEEEEFENELCPVYELQPGITNFAPVQQPDYTPKSSSSSAPPTPLHPEGKSPRFQRIRGSETGMATAEYAIATLAAVGLAGLLVVILRSAEVRGMLMSIIKTALALP